MLLLIFFIPSLWAWLSSSVLPRFLCWVLCWCLLQFSSSLFLTAALARRAVDYSPRFRGVCVIHCAFLGWLALVALKELFTTHPLYLSILGHGAKRARSSNFAPNMPAIYIPFSHYATLRVHKCRTRRRPPMFAKTSLARVHVGLLRYYGVLIQQAGTCVIVLLVEHRVDTAWYDDGLSTAERPMKMATGFLFRWKQN